MRTASLPPKEPRSGWTRAARTFAEAEPGWISCPCGPGADFARPDFCGSIPLIPSNEAAIPYPIGPVTPARPLSFQTGEPTRPPFPPRKAGTDEPVVFRPPISIKLPHPSANGRTNPRPNARTTSSLRAPVRRIPPENRSIFFPAISSSPIFRRRLSFRSEFVCSLFLKFK